MQPNLSLMTPTPNYEANKARLAPAPNKSTSGGGSYDSNNLAGVYWVGGDGNVYFKNNAGQVKNMGKGIAGSDGGFDAVGGSAEARRIDDPNPQTPSTNQTYNAPAGGGQAYPDLSGAIAMLRQNISALDPIYQTQVERAIKDYEIANNERLSAFNSTKEKSDQSAISNDQGVLQDRNAINKNARTSSEDILSILGALGMSGSTTNKALSTIADKSNANLNTANYGYGQNKQNILQSWNDYVNQDANQQKQLADQKTYNVAQAGISRDTAKKNYLQDIASNKIQMGQGTGDILGEMASVNKNIAQLSNIPRTYTGTTPTYTAPSISSLLGQNLSRFDVASGNGPTKATPKLVKVNEQTPTNNDKYGIIS